MMVTFVSQCEKKSLNKTRKVLDAFADRIGSNTWQTVITQEGLLAVKKALRKSASKNTAVSCHWIRSRSRSELVWIVGQRDKFNAEGLVPVNRTQRNLFNSQWESDWLYADSIQILAVIAALLHDIGKATIGFQKKLRATGRSPADPYRHEWLSLRLFEAMLVGCDTDNAWLTRLANFVDYQQANPQWYQGIKNDHQGVSGSVKGFEGLPPLAQIVAWLIVTHHRLPFYDRDYYKASSRDKLAHAEPFLLKQSLKRFYKTLSPLNHWVKNQKSCDEHKQPEHFWQFAQVVVSSQCWQKSMRRWASKALQHEPLMALSKSKHSIADPLLMHMARLCVMVGDHNYSSLAADDKRRVNGDPELATQLIANTDRKAKKPKQALDEHLLGVAHFTARFAKLLPVFSQELPRIIGHRPFVKPTQSKRFQWQNKSFNLVNTHQKQTDEHGFFGVNMASTGCGKTLANARIMAALSAPEQGVRFTIALGLRVLTLQTGLALRDKLDLDDTSLAILVGGAASRKLFELNQDEEEPSLEEQIGSESSQSLVKETVNYHDCLIGENELGTVIHDAKARQLLYAPVVSCTVDHMISATETTRGGRYITPMLRLLSSDLVLDEPDDFDQADLPALSRLVYMAGSLGSKVLLSSATLTPDLVSGLFQAYRAGRVLWHRHHSRDSANIVCAWFDEFSQHLSPCGDITSYEVQHNSYVEKRAHILAKKTPQRTGEILGTRLPAAGENEVVHYSALAALLIDGANTLHQRYHDCCNKTQKTASVGVIRMANIGPMVQVLEQLRHTVMPCDTQVHICCYHAKQLLLLRHSLERKLDRLLHRWGDTHLFDQPEIASAIKQSEATHHIFIVLASPVAEVGRDHDYDWAIIEPSSMRSIIQLVGRVWRHRPDKVIDKPNVLLLDSNVRGLSLGNNLGVGKPVFTRPGFETPRHLLDQHQLSELNISESLSNINAIPRIQKPKGLSPKLSLSDLEHAVMFDLMNSTKDTVVNQYWKPDSASHATVHLQRVSPFRWQDGRQIEYICMLDKEYESSFCFRLAQQAWDDLYGGDSVNSRISVNRTFSVVGRYQPWLTTELEDELIALADLLDKDSSNEISMKKLAREYATVSLEESDRVWNFHPWLGFWL